MHNIDSEIKKVIDESADFYDSDSDQSKGRIWQQVQLQQQKSDKPIWIRILAAACILLFISTSVIAILNRQAEQKIASLVELNSSLQHQIQKASILQQPSETNTGTVADTVYVEKTIPVYKAVIKTERITDTVYIERKVYIENELSQEFITASYDSNADDISPKLTAENYDTHILISSSDEVKQKKERKLQIRFGGSRNQSSKGNAALVAEL